MSKLLRQHCLNKEYFSGSKAHIRQFENETPQGVEIPDFNNFLAAGP